MMDDNKDLNKGKLKIGLTQLVIQYFFLESKGQKVPAKNFIGKNHIDRIWDTKDINYHVAIFLSLFSVIIYHRACVVYIPYEALIG